MYVPVGGHGPHDNPLAANKNPGAHCVQTPQLFVIELIAQFGMALHPGIHSVS